MPDTSYAVVLTFLGKTKEDFAQLREDYKQYMDYTIEPHLTLVFPFLLGVDISIIKDKLQAVAKRTKPFTLVLNGIEYFEETNNIAYAAVENKRPVIDLHTDITHSLDGLINDEYTEGKYSLERFIPHVTIGENIPAEIFASVKQRFSNYKIHHECKIADFRLFSDNKGIWSQQDIFELQG